MSSWQFYRHRSSAAFLLPLLLLTASIAAFSQQVADLLPSYEGQVVSAVEVAGRPNLDAASIENSVVQKAGQPLSRRAIDQTISNLKSLATVPYGRVQDVDLRIVPEMSGLRVVFVLLPGFYVGMYDFPGAERFSYTRLLQVTNYQSQQPYSDSEIQSARTALEQFLHRTGFFTATVTPAVDIESSTNVFNVRFKVKLGPRARVGKINIVGTTEAESEKLKGALRSFMARLRASTLKPGQTYSLPRLETATHYMQRQLGKQNYLAAQVKLISAEYNPETNRADVTFKVSTGSTVNIKTEGAHLWSWTRKSLIPMYQEHTISKELVQEGERDIASYFQSKGYFNAKVNTSFEQEPSAVTVVYRIVKGKRHSVKDVNIEGNTHIDDKELRPHISVQEARFFFQHGKYSQQLLASSVRNLTNYYQAAGYAEAKVTPKVTQTKGDIVVTFFINEGPLDTVKSLEIVGNNSVPESELTPKGLNLGPGKPYSQKLVQEDRNQIMAKYLSLGYLTANLRATARRADNDPHSLVVTYNVYEGPRVETENVVTIGRDQTKQSLITRATTVRADQSLSAEKMLTSEGKLYQLGIFDWAAVDPRRPITTQSNEEVLIKVHESKRNSLTYGFGFEVINRGGSLPGGTVAVPGLPPVGLPSTFTTSEATFWGPRGSIAYTRKNMRGRAETLTLSGLAGRLDQRAEATYSIPYFRKTSWDVSGTGSYEHDSTNPIFTARISNAGLQFQRVLEKHSNTWLWHYNFNTTSITNLLIPELVPPSDRFVRLSTFGTTFIHDTRDKVLDAHRGTYDSYELSATAEPLGSTASFLKFLGQSAYYRPLPHGMVWANSIRIGLEKPFSGSSVPLSSKFFSGGGSTLRGFPLNGAGPQQTIPACGNPSDPTTCTLITVPVGGNQLLILNTELRFPLYIMKNLGAAVFYDGGNVFPTIGFHGRYTNSAGFGLRYNTPVGPVRIDIGHNLSPIPGIKATQIFITLGQAF